MMIYSIYIVNKNTTKYIYCKVLVKKTLYLINPELTDYYVCGFVALWLCVSPTQYARTVRCTDEVMCYCVWYGTVRYQYRYGTVLYGTVPYGTVPYGMVHLRHGTLLYRTENLEILERGEADSI